MKNNHNQNEEKFSLTQREKEWGEVEDLVLTYQKQFEGTATLKEKRAAEAASEELLRRFSPLFKKYLSLLQTGQIDYFDSETKLFVFSFIEDATLQKALKRQKQRVEYKTEIQKRFKFVIETYGSLTEDEILMDLQMIFFIIAKRYKQMGRSFCGYLYHTYRHEVSRHIKKFIKNPINIPYKILEYEECVNGDIDDSFEKSYEDKYYEDSTGIPDIGWMSGQDCSDLFKDLNPIDRKILIKYYLEEWNDRQISEAFGIHINTVNQKRRFAVQKIAAKLDIEGDDIKRNRRSGKKAILPII